jgi:RES domain-containing protein
VIGPEDGGDAGLPPVTALTQTATHRLIPSAYLSGGDRVLTRIADDERHLQDIFALDAATNDRLLAEHGLLPGISARELVLGVPNDRVVNAAFTHAHPLGSRFNGPDRGAWYAAFALETAYAEVTFHKSVQLAEIARFEDDVTYDDYLADFRGSFHDLRHVGKTAAWLDPHSYVASQALAVRLLEHGSQGVVYPSVRHQPGTCLACLRPAAVTNVRRGRTYRFQWTGTPTPSIRPWRPKAT